MASDPRLQVVEPPGAYIYFVVSAFGLTLLVSPVIGVMLGLSRTGSTFTGRQAALVQAHGWAQLIGWVGLFVAGFSLRLLPRFSGRPERPGAYGLGALAVLVAGVLLRTAGLAAGGAGSWLGAAGGGLVGTGMLGVALSLMATLRRNRHPDAAWTVMAWCGATWWVIAGALQFVLAWTGASTGVAPSALDRAAVWAFTIGAAGNFIWAVQARMMPISFGRRGISRGAVMAPALVYNLAIVGVLLSVPARYSAALAPTAAHVFSVALGIAGIAAIRLAIVCGALGGTAERLRPASQHLARFVVWANRWAVVAGLLLVAFAVQELLPPPFSAMAFQDAALHALTTGLMTILIAGMLQLIAPVFAIERMGLRSPSAVAYAVWLLLMIAATARVAAALLPAAVSRSFNPLAELSAITGWLGLALLAGTLVRARVRDPRAASPTA